MYVPMVVTNIWHNGNIVLQLVGTSGIESCIPSIDVSIIERIGVKAELQVPELPAIGFTCQKCGTIVKDENEVCAECSADKPNLNEER